MHSRSVVILDMNKEKTCPRGSNIYGHRLLPSSLKQINQSLVLMKPGLMSKKKSSPRHQHHFKKCHAWYFRAVPLLLYLVNVLLAKNIAIVTAIRLFNGKNQKEPDDASNVHKKLNSFHALFLPVVLSVLYQNGRVFFDRHS